MLAVEVTRGLKLYQVSGEPYEIGYRLGELARPVFAGYMEQSSAWRAVRRWRGAAFVQALRDAARAHFPALLSELEGMAAGLGWSAEDVLLWNCRGELIHNASDGCTTLAAVEHDTRFIAHNEDGDPFLHARCALVDVRPVGKPGFVSFYYPGSLPGRTFAANRAGLVQTINNLRIRFPAAGVPRMIVARAVLDAASLDEGLRVLRSTPVASGFITRWVLSRTRALSASKRAHSAVRCKASPRAPVMRTIWSIQVAKPSLRS